MTWSAQALVCIKLCCITSFLCYVQELRNCWSTFDCQEILAHYGTKIKEITLKGHTIGTNSLTLSLAVNFVALDGCIGMNITMFVWLLDASYYWSRFLTYTWSWRYFWEGKRYLQTSAIWFAWYTQSVDVLLLLHVPLASLLAFRCSWRFRTLKLATAARPYSRMAVHILTSFLDFLLNMDEGWRSSRHHPNNTAYQCDSDSYTGWNQTFRLQWPAARWCDNASSRTHLRQQW